MCWTLTLPFFPAFLSFFFSLLFFCRSLSVSLPHVLSLTHISPCYDLTFFSSLSMSIYMHPSVFLFYSFHFFSLSLALCPYFSFLSASTVSFILYSQLSTIFQILPLFLSPHLFFFSANSSMTKLISL